MKIRTLAAIAGTLCLMLLCGCEDTAASESEKDLFAMDTYMSLKAYGKNGSDALKKAADEICRLDSLLSVTNESGEISALNAAGGDPVGISSDTETLIDRSLALNKETGGTFDITLYPVSREWGFSTEAENYQVPSEERLAQLLEAVGSDRISLDKNRHTAALSGGTQIDLGGIAKGYAGERAAEILRECGVKSALLNMGGNVQTVGSKPDGSKWKIGIKDPIDNSSLIGAVSVLDKAVITSGGYERYFEQNGKVYWHILDPSTGRPADSGIISATIIGTDGTTCDALSTALFVMGIGKASDYLAGRTDIDAVLVSDDGSLYITSGIQDDFTALGEYQNAEIKLIE